MTRSQATPASSQIIALERMIDARDAEIARLHEAAYLYFSKTVQLHSNPNDLDFCSAYAEARMQLAAVLGMDV